MVMVKAPAEEIRHIAEEMGQQKGVLHGSLSISSTGKELH
jgi:metal-responsive CopG/Arc/MetJ family transcriptional regulator